MTNIVRCAEYLKCKKLANEEWNAEVDCVHWLPHEFIEIYTGEYGSCHGGYCETISKDVTCMACMPESVESVDDELARLIKSAKNLGRELAVITATAPALRDASDRMWSMLQDLDAYFDELDWDEAIEEMWEEAGEQSEEDAEY